MCKQMRLRLLLVRGGLQNVDECAECELGHMRAISLHLIQGTSQAKLLSSKHVHFVGC